MLDFPQIKSVNAALYQEIDQDLAAAEGYAVDDHAVGMIRTVDNCCIWIERAKAVNMEDKSGGIQIFGSRAGLNPGGPTLYKADSRGKMVVERTSVPEDMHRSTHMLPPKAFVESIIENKPIPDCSGQEGLYIQRILNAMLESAQKSREVILS